MTNKFFPIPIALLLLMGFASGEVYNCNSCDDCNAKIDSASLGDRIQLIVDIEDYDGTCIRFENNNNITFDCDGHAIDGNDLGFNHGIYLGGHAGGTVKNCIVTDFYYGIYLYRSKNIAIVNNTAKSNCFGIRLRDSLYNSLIDNTANSNRHGIYLWDSSHNLLVNNTANSNGYYGISVVDSSGNTMDKNTACFNSVRDIYQGYGDNTGRNNTCDTTSGWNDRGGFGCAYNCEGVLRTTTTSATSTSSSTTTTIIPECVIKELKWWQKLWNSLLGWIYRFEERLVC